MHVESAAVLERGIALIGRTGYNHPHFWFPMNREFSAERKKGVRKKKEKQIISLTLKQFKYLVFVRYLTKMSFLGLHYNSYLDVLLITSNV